MTVRDTPHTLTADAFEQYALLPENRHRRLEFINGAIVEVVSNNDSSHLGMLLGGLVTAFVFQHRLGFTTGADGGYQIAGERYIPDAAFVSTARQPKPSKAAYNPTPPDLVIEALSPSNTTAEMLTKLSNYLAVGTVVWIIDPDRAQVSVHMPGAPARVYGLDDTLDGGAVLPGFSVAVRDLFAVDMPDDTPAADTESPAE